MPATHALRRGRLRAALAARDADAALVTRLVNVRYLTGLASSNAALLVPADGPAVLATDSRYALTAQRECPDLELLTVRAAEHALADLAVRRGMRRLAFEEHDVTVERHRALAAGAEDGREFVPLRRAVEELRTVKDDGEIALLARACAITGQAFDRVLTSVRPGVSEREFALTLERAMADAGADGPAFATIVASGPHGAIPHHAPTGREFRPGDMVTIDCGACCGGYHADMTRTVALAPAADWQRDLYSLVAAAQRAGAEAAVPGASVTGVDAAARDVIARAGHGEHFTHGLGHGVGLEIHEAPMLGVARPGKLHSGVCLTIEPGVYLPDRGGVRIEDTLVVRAGAPAASRDLLTTTVTVTAGELCVL